MDTNYALKKYASVTQELKLSDRKVWTAIYRGVRIEINNFSIGDSFKNSWTHYIFIHEEQLEPELFAKFWLEPKLNEYMSGRKYISYEYYVDPINQLELHGGCTYYDRESGNLSHEPKVVKIGCDYQHLWDEGRHYDVNYVFNEAKLTVDSLYAIARDKVKVRSWGDGKYRFIEEFE